MADDNGRAYDSLSAMLRDALGKRLAKSDGFGEMLADNAVMEFPYAPPGPARVEGRAAIMEHQKMLGERVTFDGMDAPVVHETVDPDTVVIEVNGYGRGTATGAAHDQHYVYVIRTRDGQIVHFKDYWNPVAYLRAL